MIYYLKYKIGVTPFCFSDPDYVEIQMDGHFIHIEHLICSEYRYTEGLGTFQKLTPRRGLTITHY